jgi:hypothetical protein
MLFAAATGGPLLMAKSKHKRAPQTGPIGYASQNQRVFENDRRGGTKRHIWAALRVVHGPAGFSYRAKNLLT